jgi:hypothetical protein
MPARWFEDMGWDFREDRITMKHKGLTHNIRTHSEGVIIDIVKLSESTSARSDVVFYSMKTPALIPL